MARQRRAASVQAEAANKKIADLTLAADLALEDAEGMARAAAILDGRAPIEVTTAAILPPKPKPINQGSSPLSSLESKTPPTPGSSFASPIIVEGIGAQRKEMATKPTLLEQVQMAKALGIGPAEGDLLGMMKKSAKGQSTNTPKNTTKIILKTSTGGTGPQTNTPKIIPKKTNAGTGLQGSKLSGGSSLMGQSGDTAANTPKTKPVATNLNKDQNKPNGGSIQKAPINNNGPVAPPPPSVDSGNALKRLSSQYLEDAPEKQDQEREHKRPAQRQWVTPGHIRRSLNEQDTTTFFQEELQKVCNVSEAIESVGPEYDLDPEQIDFPNTVSEESNESDVHVEPPLPIVPGFNDLPPSGDGPCRILSNSFIIHQQLFKHLDERSKAGIELDENETEEHRLRTTFMSLMSNQKKGILELRAKPLPTEHLDEYFDMVDKELLRLALFKLKPARNRKADPPLFAEGTWHNSRRMQDEDATLCSFCAFECDFGVADSRVWLPVEASGVFCSECHEETLEAAMGWQAMYNIDLGVKKAFQKNKDKLKDLENAASTPPLKELADTQHFKFQALRQREVRTETVNAQKERRNVPFDKRQGTEFVERSGEQVMNAFNGAGHRTSPAAMQATYRPQQSPASLVFATFPGEARKRFENWVSTLAIPQRDMFLNYIQSLDAQRQWEFFSTCSTPGFTGYSAPTAQDVANRQAIINLVEALRPDQQQFFMQNLSQEARSHMSPPMARNPSNASQTINNEMAGHNYQRRLSNGSNQSTLQTSSQRTPTAAGPPNAQQVGTAAHGHQRRPSYTSLPAPSPQTMINFGGSVTAQNNRLHGPGGNSSPTSIVNGAMPGNHNPHRRMPIGSYPAAMPMLNPNPNSSFPPNGWHMNGPGGSPPMNPSSFSQGPPGRNHQQMPQSPAIGTYGSGPSNSYHGPVMNGRGGSPPMQPFMPRGQQIANSQTRSHGTHMTGANMVNGTSKSSTQANSGVARNLVAPQNGAKETGNASTKSFVPKSSTHSQPSNSGNYPPPLQTADNTKSVQVIKLTRSGGTIGPTTIPKAPVNLGQHQNSHVQPVTGSAGNPALRPAHPQMSKNANARPPPAGSSSTPLVGLGISNSQTMMGGGTNNSYAARPDVLLYPQNAHIRRPESSAASPAPNMPPLGHFSTSTSHPSNSSTNASQSHTHPHPPVLRHAHTATANASSMAQPSHPERRQTISQPATSFTQYQQLLFCRGCPWRQIDITKARICEPCKAEKLEIIKHRHTVFIPLNRGVTFEDGEGISHSQFTNTPKRTCMVCTGLATRKCIDCPLRICTTCEGLLTLPCKLSHSLPGATKTLIDDEAVRGKIWCLVEFFAKQRVHVRNDVVCFLPATPIAGFMDS